MQSPLHDNASRNVKRFSLFISLAFILLALLAGCGSKQKETPAAAASLPPTWTPTPYQSPTPAQPTDTPAPPTQAPDVAPTDTPPPPPPTDTPPPPTATPTPEPKVVITADLANLRTGPGVNYDRAGSVKNGDQFIILGKNPAGDWWQIQVNQQPYWIYSSLVRVENAEAVAVAQNIPAPPVRPPQPPPPPTNTPAPAAPDPCATIGGDGCKWRIRSGPAFAANNGMELKLTFGFVHGGRGDEAQGSYFVWLEKDGVKLPVSDGVRSWTGDKRQGPNGAYNYEYKLGLNQLPGNTVAGCYTGWVLDGNGERDSQNFQFCVPEGQGEVYILFDQS